MVSTKPPLTVMISQLFLWMFLAFRDRIRCLIFLPGNHREASQSRLTSAVFRPFAPYTCPPWALAREFRSFPLLCRPMPPDLRARSPSRRASNNLTFADGFLQAPFFYGFVERSPYLPTPFELQQCRFADINFSHGNSVSHPQSFPLTS